jgi:serine/threonine-protein kinase
VVFRARAVKTDHIVALKVIAPEFPANDAEVQRFVGVLKVTPALRHPNLVTTYGAGKNGPYCWIAREYVEGEGLAKLIRRLSEERKLDWTRACRVAVHLGRALAFLHEQRLVHRNLTPRNVLVRAGDKLTKLADLMYGQALQGSRLEEAIAEKKLLTELPFLAPEQTEPDAFVDRLADLYALGAVVYALLTGRPPFAGDSPEEVLAQIQTGQVVRPTRYQRGIPAPFEAAVLKLLARRQEDRYQSATELLADVEPLAAEHAVKV